MRGAMTDAELRAALEDYDKDETIQKLPFVQEIFTKTVQSDDPVAKRALFLVLAAAVEATSQRVFGEDKRALAQLRANVERLALGKFSACADDLAEFVVQSGST
jgi:hypothetical protein